MPLYVITTLGRVQPIEKIRCEFGTFDADEVFASHAEAVAVAINQKAEQIRTLQDQIAALHATLNQVPTQGPKP